MVPSTTPLAIPAGGIDADHLAVFLAGILGVGHPADQGIDHDQTADAHLDILVPVPPLAPVGNGPGPVFAGDDLLVGGNQTVPVDIKDGAVETGKGDAGGILAEGA